jgi:hypothetical protein
MTSGIGVIVADSGATVQGITDANGRCDVTFEARPEGSEVDVSLTKANTVINYEKGSRALTGDTVRVAYSVRAPEVDCSLAVNVIREDGRPITGTVILANLQTGQPLNAMPVPREGSINVPQARYEVRVRPDPGQNVTDTTFALNLQGRSSHQLGITMSRIIGECDTYLREAETAMDQGDLALATASYERACNSADPVGDSECFRHAHMTLAGIRMSETEMRNIPEAVRRLNALLVYYPANAKAHYHLGQIFMADERWDEATAEFMDVVSECGQLPEQTCCQAKYNLGDCYYRWSQSYKLGEPAQIGRLREALAQFDGITTSLGCPSDIRDHAKVLADHVAQELRSLGQQVGR